MNSAKSLFSERVILIYICIIEMGVNS